MSGEQVAFKEGGQIRKRVAGSSEIEKLPQDASMSCWHGDGTEDINSTGRSKEDHLHLGKLSRQILQPEASNRSQPLKMKKHKKRKHNVQEPLRFPKDHEFTPPQKQYFWRKKNVRAKTDAKSCVAPELSVIYSMKELILYALFFSCLSWIVWTHQCDFGHYNSKVVKDLVTCSKFLVHHLNYYKTFDEIRSVHEFWSFIHQVLIKFLNEEVTSEGVFEKNDLVLMESVLVGAPRIRQIRVKGDSCFTVPLFGPVYKTCYGYYDPNEEDKRTFGTRNSPSWNYHSPIKGETSFTGHASTYPGGGFGMNISGNHEFTEHLVQELENNNWIQIGTRAIFIDFTLFSQNGNVLSVAKLAFEVVPTGGVIPSSKFETTCFPKYIRPNDYISLGCWLILILLIFYYTGEVICQIIFIKTRYVTSWWRVIVDLCIVLISYVCITQEVLRSLETYLAAKELLVGTSEHISYDRLAKLYDANDLMLAILMVFAFLKILMLVSCTKVGALILSTYGKIQLELLTLSVMTVIFVIGFAILGTMTFGGVEQFRALWVSFFTLITMLISGLYYYKECNYMYPNFAPPYFIAYILIYYIIFINFFVALVVRGFLKAVNDDEKREHVYLGHLFWELVYQLLNSLRMVRTADRIHSRELTKLYTKDYDALVDILRRHGCRRLDLLVLLKKHGVESGKELSFETMSLIYNEWFIVAQLRLEVENHYKLKEEMDKIIKMIEKLEQTQADVAAKVNLIQNMALLKKKA